MEQESEDINSLYDFIYVDRDRLASYSAQLFNDGILSSAKKSVHSQDAKSKTFSGHLGVASAALDGLSTIGEVYERTFDASWTLPLNVINSLDEHGFIKKDFKTAGMGSVVLVKGSAALLDVGLIKSLWEPALDFFVSFLPDKTARHRSEKKQLRDQWSKFGNILSRFPLSVQIHLDSEGSKLWASLNQECMIARSDDIALKYGGSITGECIVIGVLDARPDEGDRSGESEHLDADLDISDFSNLFAAMTTMMNSIRDLVGRPSGAYGITPIMISRIIRNSS